MEKKQKETKPLAHTQQTFHTYVHVKIAAALYRFNQLKKNRCLMNSAEIETTSNQKCVGTNIKDSSSFFVRVSWAAGLKLRHTVLMVLYASFTLALETGNGNKI